MSKIDTMTDDMWVHVDFGVPAHENDVLVWAGFMDIAWRDTERGRWYSAYEDEWIEGVTHWMPLPDPPEEKR